MSDPVGLVSGLQSCLQQSISKKDNRNCSVSWSWVCIKLINILSNYPSGVTRAIAMSELDSEFQKSGGKLNAFQSPQHQRVTTVAKVLDSKSVQFESVLEVQIPSFHDVPGTTTKIAHLMDNRGDEKHLQMYLHRNFYDIIHILATHTVRVSCCRLVTSNASSNSGPTVQLCLLPTEHMAVLVDTTEVEEMEERFPGSISLANLSQPAYIDNIRAKVVNIGEAEALFSSDGTSYHRLIVQLGVDEEDSLSLILWDSYTGFARLFTKGDTLFIERPYARPTSTTSSSSCNDSSVCLEFGPATLLYVLPYEPEEEIFLSLHPTQPSIFVKKTDDGKLDFLSYPERLCIDDLHPSAGMINGVLMVQCLTVGKRERVIVEREPTAYDLFQIEVQDNTESVSVTITDPTFKVFDSIHQCQWLLMTGLSSESTECDGELCLSCNMRCGGQVVNVSALPGLLMSLDLYSTLSLEEAQSVQPLTQFMVSATLKEWLFPQNETMSKQLLKPTHCTCKGQVEMVNQEQGFCPICQSYGLSMLKSSDATKKGLSSYWKWAYNLKTVLEDDSTHCSITVQFTSNSAETLLQRSAEEASSLSEEGLLKLLIALINVRIIACISKVSMEEYQLNCALMQDQV